MENTGESPCSILSARRDQRSLIPRHAHAPAPSPSRRWSIRCIAFALVTDGNLGTPLAPRFRLRFGCAPLHSGLLSAIRCAPFLRSAPALRRPDRSALRTNFSDCPQPPGHKRFRGSRLAREEYLANSVNQKAQISLRIVELCDAVSATHSCPKTLASIVRPACLRTDESACTLWRLKTAYERRHKL